MTSNEVMYGLYWIAVLAMLAVSWSRSRNILHPHFIFTVMLCVHLSDFLIRGYDDENLAYIPIESVHTYQLLILITIVATVFLSSLLRAPRIEAAVVSAWEGIVPSKGMIRAIGAVAWLIVCAEILKRLISVGWSPSELLSQMLNPRGERVWDQEQYGGNFIYAIVSLLLPLSSSSFAYIVVNGRGFARSMSVLGFLLLLAIQITDGARTMVVMTLAALALFTIQTQRTALWKALILGADGVAGAAATSFMYLFRSTGYKMDAVQGEFAFTYHQDDSYYRAIYAHYVSDYSSYSWDPLYFIYAKLMNPIPRFFWPDKPLLDQTFYGEYKLYYVTMLYIGDIVAMAGPLLTLFIAIPFGLAVYYMLYRSAALLLYPLGVIAYLLGASYVYMILRSTENLMQFIYLPAFAVLLVQALRRRPGADATRQARPRARGAS
ncbi:MAG: hypothetical protein WBO09_08765 [Methylocystis silviterrae]|uniref:hypothetical protein n=1 Tax=Methylocystis silviterrae TaxID=2743612 RepID=UPI003C740A08